MIDPAIDSHYGTGYERSRLFAGGRPSLEYERSMELLERLLPGPPARVLNVGGGPGTYAAPLAGPGYRVHLVDPGRLHVEQARQAAGSDPAAVFTAALGDAPELSEPDESQTSLCTVQGRRLLRAAADQRHAAGGRMGGRLTR